MSSLKKTTLLTGIVFCLIINSSVQSKNNNSLTNNFNLTNLVQKALDDKNIESTSSNSSITISTPNINTTYSFTNDKLTSLDLKRTKDEITSNTLNTYEYNNSGNLVKATTSGQTIDVTYSNNLNAESKAVSVNGIVEMTTTNIVDPDTKSQLFEKTYANGNIIKCNYQNNVGSILSSSGDSISFETDEKQNILVETNNISNDETQRAYDEENNIVSKTYGSFLYEKETNDNNGTLEYITIGEEKHSFQQIEKNAFSYDGKLIAIEEDQHTYRLFLNGSNIIYSYLEQDDEDNKTMLDEITYGNKLKLSYKTDDYGHILDEKDRYNLAYNTYTYDDYGQLSSWTYDGGQQKYEYDDRGNLIKETHDNGDVFDYKMNNQISKYCDELMSINNEEILNDSSHNIIGYSGNTYSYKRENLMSSFSNSTTSAEYEYDASALRIWKKFEGKKTSYFYVNGILQAEILPDDTKVTYLHDDKGDPLGFMCFNKMYCYLKDGKGQIIGILNEDGEIIMSYSYDPWGKIISIKDSSKIGISKINHILYKGYYYDEESNMYYIGHRYYNPTIRRFMSMDDLEYISQNGTNELYANLFAYAQNDPIMKGDLLGHEAITIAICSSILIVSTVFMIYKVNTLFNSISKSMKNQSLTYAERSVFTKNSTNIKNLLDSLRNILIAAALSKLVWSWLSWLTGDNCDRYEVHHIIAQKHYLHEEPRNALTKIFNKNIDCEENLIPLRYRLHKHLHTNLYFLTTGLMFSPYETEKYKTEFFVVLGIIKGILLAVNVIG